MLLWALATFIPLLLVPFSAAAVTGQCTSASERALPHLAAADRAMAKRDGRTANLQIDAALVALGRAYFAPPMKDDTGMHLVFAETEARKGKLAKAALLKRRVLIERLQLCAVEMK